MVLLRPVCLLDYLNRRSFIISLYPYLRAVFNRVSKVISEWAISELLFVSVSKWVLVLNYCEGNEFDLHKNTQLISIWMVVHQDSLWTWGMQQLENGLLLWFCITSLSDWFKVLAPFFQPIRSETKTNRGSRVHIFPRFVSARCNYFEFWLVYWIVSVLFDWPK